MAVLTFGWLPVEKSGRAEREQIEQLLRAVAPTYAAEMAREGHASIQLNTPPSNPTYQRLLQLQREWLKTNPAIADVYTMRKLPDGSVALIVDSDTDYDHDGKIEGDREQITPIGQPYTEKDAGLDKALAGEANFDQEIINDQWGSWVGAWAPIYDKDGKVEAVLGVDYDAKSWLKATAAARLLRIGNVALLLATIGAGLIANALLRSDLRQRQAMAEDLRCSRERLLLHVRQAPLAIIEWDTEARVVDWNPAAERIFGFAKEEVLGKKAFDLIVPEKTRAIVEETWAALLRNSGGQNNENENRTKSGRTISCEWFNTRLVDHDGQIVGVLSLAQDVSQRRELEAQVQQTQKMHSIGQLAAGIAHDFNNILTIIQGHVELLLPRRDLPADATTDLQQIATAAERAANLTRQLLSFSRKQVMIPRPIDLNEVVAGITSMLCRLLGETIALRCELASRLPLVFADPNLIEQVILNLVLNARDAMPRGGELVIATRAAEATPAREGLTGSCVALSISDTGTGIPQDQLPLIFEPFFTTKDVGTGTGLGLSAVHGIVKQHRGAIQVRSEIGKGTTVEVFLPVSNRSPECLTPTKKPGIANHRTVLVVEDEEPVRRLARHVLENNGYRVLEASDGVEAQELWNSRSHDISLLLTDLVMPNGITGHDLGMKFRREKPELKVIYASGYSMQLTAPEFCESRNEVFIAKPYLPRQLMDTVRRFFEEEV